MRVLFLADAVFLDLPGGSRVAARELATGLIEKGHDVTFLVGKRHSDSPDVETVEGYGRIVRYGGAGEGLQFIRQGRAACKRLCEKERFDVVHTHFAFAATGPLSALPPSTRRVRTFHGPWDEEAYFDDTSRLKSLFGKCVTLIKQELRRTLEAANLRKSDAVITLSNCFRRKINERYGLPIDHVQIVPGGADLQRFQPTSDKRACRQSLGLPINRQILFSVRRLAPRMGLDNLILAMPEVIAKNPDVLLLIGGKGPQKAQLEQLVEGNHLQDHVKLLGFIPDDKLSSYYQAADLFVLPTVALEGFGLVTTEALASGLPVVGTPVGGTPEILANLNSRLIADGTAPNHLAKAINSFLTNTWNLELTPDKLHRYVCENFTWEKHVDAVESIYVNLVGQSELTKTPSVR